ncbi:phage portal protein [Vagococcus sp. BWB3-3]|uniref:Phage portal protein n=1 Tax=Vagococcus allomyrinae TaxID=2794353 RepID=A0A940PFT5_9ENTE|nr:terminase large subunit [Vagococcus allomyrinae]MBP1043817.1 phage portal protein [Vagococcus allomyrinae]
MEANFALDYADKVLNGEIIAGKKIIQAVTRFKRDLKRSEQSDFPYYFNNDKATQSIKFMGLLPGTDGSRIEMLLFQKWLIAELNGWREKETDNRRYNRAFISMSRKNGKTYLVSGMGSNSLLMEKEPAEGRQILFVSNALKQSKIGYNMMAAGLRNVTKQSKYMRQRLKILNSQITDLESNSFAIALASETSTLDGFGATTAILDEWHEAKDRKVYNVIKSGMSNQKNGLLAVVSTAGLNINVPMFEEYEFLSKVLDGKEEADRYFIAIWELDDKEEIHNEDLYIKANPIFESEEIKNTMIQAIRDDVALGIKQSNLNAVLVKNFNLWLQASDNSYVASEDWANAEVEELDIQGKSVYVGIDLSKTNDLTSLSWIIPLEEGQFYCDSHSDVFTAVKIIASDIASSQLQVVKGGMVDEQTKLDYLINVKPNSIMDGWHFKFALAANMLLNGNSFAEIVRKGEEITELNLLLNSETSLKQSDSGSLYYEVTEGTNTRKLDAENVLHFKYFSQDGIVGLSPLHSL